MKVTIDINQDELDILTELANKQGITATTALRKAIATEKYLLEEREAETTILLQKKNGEVKEVIWR